MIFLIFSCKKRAPELAELTLPDWQLAEGLGLCLSYFEGAGMHMPN